MMTGMVKKMFEFMANAFYVLGGVACVFLIVIIGIAVITAVDSVIKKYMRGDDK